MAGHHRGLLPISRPQRALCRSCSRSRLVRDQQGALDCFLPIIPDRSSAGISHLGEIVIGHLANLRTSHLPFFPFCGIILQTRQVVNEMPLS